MERQDDPTIIGTTVLYRRIPPEAERVRWNEGVPEPSKQNFKDRDDELSCHIANETKPEIVLAGHDGYGLVQITVDQFRAVFLASGRELVICRDGEDPSNGHVLICGRMSNGMAKTLRDNATWVEGCLPRRREE